MDEPTSLSHSERNHYPLALPKGTDLFEFKIDSVLGHGEVGITYRAIDTVLEEIVIIKEFFPAELAGRGADPIVRVKSESDLAAFHEALRTFLDEAQLIARFRHPNIVQVRRFFELHRTGYVVLGNEKGESLHQRLNRGAVPEPALRTLLMGLLDGLEVLHDRGILHRDIKPSNVIIRSNGTPVLIDFIAARDFKGRHSRSITAMASYGYAPPEQYGIGGQQGPWSDLFGLGAIAYQCVTGRPPVDSLRRLRHDPMVPSEVAAAGKYDPSLLRTIDWMLKVDEPARPQSANQVRDALLGRLPDTNRDAESTTGSLTVTEDGVGYALLEFDQETSADVLELAFFVTPPGMYLAHSSGPDPIWDFRPQYFPLDRAASESAIFRGGPDVVSYIASDAQVRVVSSDSFIDASTIWPKLPGGPITHMPRAKRGSFFFLASCLLLVLLGIGGFAAFRSQQVGDFLCERFGLFCNEERLAMTDTRKCLAQTPSCSTVACATKFKHQFAKSHLIAQVVALEGPAVAACDAEDKRQWGAAISCAGQKAACEMSACFQEYQTNFPDGHFSSDAIKQVSLANSICEELAEFNKAVECTRVKPCSSDCFTAYRARYTDAPRLRTGMDAALAKAQSACHLAQQRPIVSSRLSTLRDGDYDAERGYTGPRNQSDPINCPPRITFLANLSNGAIKFEGDQVGSNGTHYTRSWLGHVRDQADGAIVFMGSDARPPTEYPWTITGRYDDAIINSDYCGPGFFRIFRQR